MKELSVEEKAKAYDELKVKASRIYNKENDVLIMHTIEDLFPEFRESDDEKIRKELLAVIDDLILPNEQKERFVAWLEKQGEHAKFRDSIQVGDKVTRNEDGVLVNLSQLNRVAKKKGEQKPIKEHDVCDFCGNRYGCVSPCPTKLIEEQKPAKWSIFDYRTWQYIVSDVLTKKDGIGQYLDSGECKNIAKYMQEEWSKKLSVEQMPKELLKGEDYGVDGLYHAISILEKTLGEVEGYQSDDGILEHKIAIDTLKALYNQKSAWSEEDELHIRELESLVKQVWAKAEHGNDKDTIHKMSDLSFFLKTLKPQLKQEWSEEDRIHYNKCLQYLESISPRKEDIEWFKSLKPQSHWKPSDEQLDMLAKVCSTLHLTSGENEIMESIYDALKKLREE